MRIPDPSLRPQSAPPIIVVNGPDSPPRTASPSSQMITIDPSDRSSTTTQVDNEAIVGSRNTHSGQQRLRLVNNLHDIELDIDIDLPRIAVIGSQSSGKSSLIQAVSGIPLLKAPGDACTRCPIECRLTHGDGPWSCRVFLRRITASRGQSSSGQPKEPFGDVIVEKEMLEDRILRAQLAILNPKTPAQEFLEESIDLNTALTELSFSPNIICLEITGREYSDISFVDLPGLIRNVGTSGNRDNIQLIENLVTGYISKENCIILMTITCETDFANQGAYDLARQYDPHGRRTVGVLTKPDRSPEAAQEKWARYISGEVEPLDHGWFCVKLPDTQSAHPQPTLVEAREQEDCWFKKERPWYGLPRQAQSHLGTTKLVRHLEDILSNLISLKVPDIIVQVQELAESTTQELNRLGKPPSDDCIGDINSLIDQLVRDVEGGVERRSRDDGNVLYLIEDEAVRFKNELRVTCPEFRAWNKNTVFKDQPSVTRLPELLLEDGELPAADGTRKIIFLDDVLNKKSRSSVRGLPDGGQTEVAEEYLRSFIANWDMPTSQFVNRATNLLRIFIRKTVDARCGHFLHGGLPTHMYDTIEAHLQECDTRTRTATALLLKLERNGHTRNDRYYRDCKDKFLSHLKMQRGLASPENNTVLRDLNRMASPGGPSASPTFTSAVNTAKASLGKIGLSVDEHSLVKLLPPSPADSALEDMASASAGFEVALHRFVDYVPLVVDTELVRGVCEGLAPVLRRSFGFSSPGAVERCSDLLQEPLEVKRERERLIQRLHRLALATEELHHFWGP
ncbi:P-loop containing nucleoside triphosphate hydrolase protein [Lactifluus subvellereus]|nr:P-loop containing nucleoside triphosphate hydrolase protein [Lactifluus subvellereus]